MAVVLGGHISADSARDVHSRSHPAHRGVQDRRPAQRAHERRARNGHRIAHAARIHDLAIAGHRGFGRGRLHAALRRDLRRHHIRQSLPSPSDGVGLGMAIKRVRNRSFSIHRPSAVGMVASYLLLCVWALVVLFPLYWLAITSFKTPLDVNGGPFYWPFRDFQPTLESWRYIFVDLGEDTFRPYLNTVVVGLTSTTITVLLGAMAAYGLVRMRYRVSLGAIGSFVAGVALTVAAIVAHVPWPVGAAVGFALFLLLLNTLARRSKRGVGNDDIAFWMISQRMLPPVAVVIPIYIFFQQLELLDTWAALIIAYLASPLPIVVSLICH